MSGNLYIAAIEPGSGKSLVVLGVMELLSKRIGKVGFFRPVIHVGNGLDNDIELVRSRYQIDLPYEMHYALTHEEARSLVADGNYDELLKRIIERYKALERQCNFVICEGIEPVDLGSAFVDNFDTRVANLLSAPILMVANGQGKTTEEIIDTMRTVREALLDEGCVITATIVNRIPAEQLLAVRAH